MDLAWELQTGAIPYALAGRQQEDMLQELRRLSLEMQVEFRYMKDPKSGRKSAERNPHFAEADRLASKAAWQARLERQGYVSSGATRLEGDEAKEFVERMAHRGSSAAQGRLA